MGRAGVSDINQIWKGPNPETGESIPDLPELPDNLLLEDQDDYHRILKRYKVICN